MKLLVVGGHTRSIGKTALVVDLLRAFREGAWTAVKITQYGHGVCARNGEKCKCVPDEHTVALDEERSATSGTDTARFLEAGASHALWLRTKQGRLADGLPLLQEALERDAGPHGNVLVESNSLLEFVRPVLHLVVLDPSREDFKETAQRYLHRADAFILRRPFSNAVEAARDATVAGWQGQIWTEALGATPQFLQPLGEDLPGALVEFVRQRFFG